MTQKTPAIYLDYHATTPVDPRVLAKMLPYFTEHFGNAMSGQHHFGWTGKEAVENARSQVAKLIGGNARDIIFTAGATESIHLAILGLFENAENETGKKYHLITSAIEHKCVLEVAHHLEKLGHKVTYLETNKFGEVELPTLVNAFTPDTLLVSLIHANNEVGALVDVPAVAKACHERGVLLHLDSAQICGKHPINVVELGIDMLSLSAHKLYGPKGTGALYVRQTQPRVRLTPFVLGGGQERGLRSGTQNVPGIVGLGEACEIAGLEMSEERTRITELRDHALKRLSAEIPDFVLNGPPSERRLCNNLNFSIEGVLPDQMLMHTRGLAFSSGSACASGEDSHVLAHLRPRQGLEGRDFFTARFGLGRMTTLAEIDAACTLMAEAARKARGV